MSMREQAFRVAVLGALKDRIASEWADQRVELLAQLLEAQTELGVKSLDVSLPDGTRVASVTLTQPSARVEVIDEDAFTAWVAERWPDEVQTTRAVRSSFRKALLDRLVVDEEMDQAVDGKTGELVEGTKPRPPSQPTSFSVRYADGGRDAIAEAWRQGRLAGYAPVELEGGS